MTMNPRDCLCNGHSSPFWSEGFTRRRFLKIGATGLVASYFADVLSPSLLEAAVAVTPALQRTARTCIFIFLQGGPSQVDLWDLKEGAWTPSDLAPTSYGDVRWPHGLLPKTADHLGKLAIIRSGLAWAAVHPLAQKWAQMARTPSGASGSFSPHIGAVVSLESQLSRRASDVLPGFVALNGTAVGVGYLPAQNTPFPVQPSPTGLSALTHPDGAARLDDRWKAIHGIDGDRITGARGRDAADMASFSEQARLLIDAPNINQVFSFTEDERVRYGSTGFGDSLLVSRNLVAANRGTRFVQVTLSGWDHHSDIYATADGGSIYGLSKTLDGGLSALLADLSTTPGVDSGKTLLDETLVILLGEFGRTVGALTESGGRDHYLRMSVVAAGGGVRGGRIIGSTNQIGDQVKEFGWSANRDIRPEDLTSTIYSALGIDYTTVRHDDPLGIGFEYVPFAKDGVYRSVDELF